MKGLKLAVKGINLHRTVLWYTLFTLSLILIYPISVFAAAPDVLIKAEKTQFLGGEFRVDIVIESVTNLYGIAFDLNYDPKLLEVVDSNTSKKGIQPKITEGSFLNNNGTDTTYMKAALEDDTPGKLVIGLSRSGGVGGVSSSTEKVSLSIYFRSVKAGTSSMTADRKGLKDDQNKDIAGKTWGELALNVQEYNWTGDVNQDKSIDLTDMNLVLKMLTRHPEKSIYAGSDVNQNGKIGLEEGINALQHPK